MKETKEITTFEIGQLSKMMIDLVERGVAQGSIDPLDAMGLLLRVKSFFPSKPSDIRFDVAVNKLHKIAISK